MAEIRVAHLAIGFVLLGLLFVCIGMPALIFFGMMPGCKELGLTKEDLDKKFAAAKGYTAATTPDEAMTKFKEAIHARDYQSASFYCTKGYAAGLKKAHAKASELGGLIDKIRNWADGKGLLTDKQRVALFHLDPFPKNFKTGAAPKMDGDKKAYGVFDVEIRYTLKNPGFNFGEDLKQLDPRMFQNVLSFTAAPGKILLVKEGDEWKLDLPATPAWEAEVSYYNDRATTYITALNGLWKNLNNERIDTGGALENDVMQKLRECK